MDTIIIIGAIESGGCHIGDKCLIMPSKIRVEIKKIYHEDIEIDSCLFGQYVRLELKNVKGEQVNFLILLIITF
jgi:translation elongation factor EF-1alpha